MVIFHSFLYVYWRVYKGDSFFLGNMGVHRDMTVIWVCPYVWGVTPRWPWFLLENDDKPWGCTAAPNQTLVECAGPGSSDFV